MSWKGFQKAVARIPPTGKVHWPQLRTKDDEYEVYDASFKQLDTLARQLAAESRKFKDQLGIMLAHQAGLSRSFQEMFVVFTEDYCKPDTGFSQDHANVTDEFQTDMAALKELLSSDLDMIERLVVAPTGDFITILDQVKKVIVKRSHKLLDYDRHREATQKLRDRTDRTASDEKRLGQYESALDQATREYNNINIQLKRDLPILLGLRVDFIDPCLLAFYTYQMKVYQTLHAKFSNIAHHHIDTHTSAIDGYKVQAEAVQELLTILVIPKRNLPNTSQPQSIDSDPATLPAYSDAVDPQMNAGVSSGQSASTHVVPPTTSNAASASTTLTRAIPPIPGPKYVVALYDFQAQTEGDLSFSRDDKIEVIKRTPDVNDWWVGTTAGRTGQFPGNYVKEL
ncbi:hypothetical protein BSLG_006882 [Batrachochytrium salamandrivorans]|nr:hypothetical protein BSLG_006882 [Batrachochytrium salamandrivorans]